MHFDAALNVAWLLLGGLALARTIHVTWSQPCAAPRSGWLHIVGVGLIISQKPFAIVIVGGLSATLLLSVYVLPTIYTWIAGDRDILPAYEPDLAEPH